ncbi:MAG: hypothetical protein IPK48_08430 [Gammaproteobacteria bacterium]|nr:hypothetical protein [Gammaproteobacteria bacterium]
MTTLTRCSATSKRGRRCPCNRFHLRVAGDITPCLLGSAGWQNPIPVYCDIAGTFPQHPPDPACPTITGRLAQSGRRDRSELGIALDGDGDRLVMAVSGGEHALSTSRMNCC